MRTAAVVVAIALSWSPAASGDQQPSFRAGVDLIAVDAQVVDSTGAPLDQLGPEHFDVTLNGRRRRVVSADFRWYGTPSRPVRPDAGSLPSEPLPGVGPLSPQSLPERGPLSPKPRSGEGGRIFIIAVDASSFEVGAARAPLEAAQAFVTDLAAGDYVGLYTYPSGPRVVPGLNRVAVRQALAMVPGERMPFAGSYQLRPSEVVDITAMGGPRPGSLAGRALAALGPNALMIADPMAVVQQRECPDEPECASRILAEAQAMALHYEAQARRSLDGLAHLLRVVADLPGRKTVVLVTAGVMISDRPGGRPEVGDLAVVLGQVAARSNATLYTIHVDDAFARTYAASSRRTADLELSRDRTMAGDWLDRFSATAGGTRFYVPVGAGEFAFERGLRET